MRYNNARLPFSNLVKNYLVISSIVKITFNIFFTITRLFNKLIANRSRQIIVIALQRIGDTVFTIPTIKELQKKHNCQLIIICFTESVPIYKLSLSNVNYCTLAHNDFYLKGLIAKRKARYKVKLIKPEIIYDLTGTSISVSLIFNIRAKQIIGMNRVDYSKMYDNFITFRTQPHLMDMYLDASFIFFNKSIDESIKIFPVSYSNKGEILIHPFAGWSAKEWNFNKFIELASRLKKDYKVRIVFQHNRIMNDVIAELIENKLEIIETKSLEELINKIKLCSIFIGNDSGPLYIASLLGKPTFTLYGPTNSKFSLPYGEYHQCVVKSLPCSPVNNNQYCFTLAGLNGCPSFECINQLNVENVYNAFITFNKNFN